MPPMHVDSLLGFLRAKRAKNDENEASGSKKDKYLEDHDYFCDSDTCKQCAARNSLAAEAQAQSLSAARSGTAQSMVSRHLDTQQLPVADPAARSGTMQSCNSDILPGHPTNPAARSGTMMSMFSCNSDVQLPADPAECSLPTTSHETSREAVSTQHTAVTRTVVSPAPSSKAGSSSTPPAVAVGPDGRHALSAQPSLFSCTSGVQQGAAARSGTMQSMASCSSDIQQLPADPAECTLPIRETREAMEEWKWDVVPTSRASSSAQLASAELPTARQPTPAKETTERRMSVHSGVSDCPSEPFLAPINATVAALAASAASSGGSLSPYRGQLRAPKSPYEQLVDAAALAYPEVDAVAATRPAPSPFSSPARSTVSHSSPSRVVNFAPTPQREQYSPVQYLPRSQEAGTVKGVDPLVLAVVDDHLSRRRQTETDLGIVSTAIDYGARGVMPVSSPSRRGSVVPAAVEGRRRECSTCGPLSQRRPSEAGIVSTTLEHSHVMPASSPSRSEPTHIPFNRWVPVPGVSPSPSRQR